MCDDLNNGYDIEGGEPTCEEPTITWEWNPGDVGEYGDGILVITAKGDGFVMLEADDRSRTGQDEATMNIKAEYGQTIVAEAYIARAGTPISPIARETIVVPEKDQPSEPTPGPAPESKCPVLAFGDENGKQINEISLAPGQQKKIQIILKEHPEVITKAFQAQWIMYDSKHQPTGSITCVEDPEKKTWFYPLNLSTSVESRGGSRGNVTDSASYKSTNWRCVAYNSRNEPFWHPRGQFSTPVAVAEFTIQAPSNWKDTFATFELDPEWSLFIESTDATAGSFSQYNAKCNYDMKLTIKNEKPDSGTSHSPESKCPVLAFGDENGKQINEISLAPGQQKKVQIILKEHPEVITKAFQAQWIMYDSKHQPTDGITCVQDPDKKKWFFPLNLSTSAESRGGLKGNVTDSASYKSTNWRCMAYNSQINHFWHPRGQFTTPVAVAEFTIQAPSDWNDTFATFELDPEWTLFVETADATVGSQSQYEATCNYDMKLTIKNEKSNGGTSGFEPNVNPAPESRCPVLAFGDENDNPIKEVYLAPGEQKTIRLILTKHPEVITMGNRLVFYLRDSSGKSTQGIAFDSDYDCGSWIKPLNLSTSNTSVGGLHGNTVNDDHGEIGRYICSLINTEKNQVWYPRGNFMPPIAVGEFVIKASSDWNDAYATIEADPKKTQFVLTAETAPFSLNNYEVSLDYTLVLTVKNKNKHQGQRE